MKTLTYRVAADTVAKLQSLDARVNSMNSIINGFLNSHMNDVDATAIESSVFKVYQEKAESAFMEYESAKNIMFITTVPEDVRLTANSWNLDFYTGELSVVVK